MSKDKSQKAGALATGIATIIGVFAHANKSKKWEDFHTFLVLIGAGMTIYGAT
ncbi:MAG: hypothetical protein WA860_01700 [Acidimicrobiales bacterium]